MLNSLRASSPIWGSEASLAKTRERAAKPRGGRGEARFACPNKESLLAGYVLNQSNRKEVKEISAERGKKPAPSL